MHQDTGMLKGFTVPKSPFGQAALMPAPPWHYAGDVVGVEFWTDPGATAATLPNGLSRDPNSNGRAVMMFLDWQFTAQGDEYLEPARYQYREASILVDAMYRDEPVMWCPYIYVDNDAALACGWTRGFPKKIGSIFQTRSFAVSGLAAAPVASGSRFGASLSAHGQRLADWRCRSPTISPLPAHGSERASLISRKRMVKNYTRSRRAGSSLGFVTHFHTQLAI
jgi:Acetoacetate decarboxylase (ADC)